MKAVVLSGGGAFGAYQIGVWKALKKLKFKYKIVTGTSVGALNAALMTQKSYSSALLLWNNLNSNMVYDETIETKNGKLTKDSVKKYAKSIFFDGGMYVGNLEKTVRKYVNVKKIYSSNVDMGIVTLNYSNMKALQLTKKQIKEDEFVDYLIASASPYPAFQKKKIKDDYYIDGGFYDNLPINLAIDMGATEIIAVDLKAVGIKRRIKNKNVKITIISPKQDLGSFLVFEKSKAKKNIILGYQDTMKKFCKLEGDSYTFKIGTTNKLYKYYFSCYISKLRKILELEDGIFQKLLKIKIYNDLLKEEDVERNFLLILENIFENLEISLYSTYDFSKIKRILKKIKVKKEFNIVSFVEKKSVILYFYNLLIMNDFKKLLKMILIFPELFLQALYLYIIRTKN